MDWFQHRTASHEDPDISEAWDEFGDKAYVAFFVILEIYGREYNRVDNDGYLEITKKYLCRKLRRKWKIVELILNWFLKRKRFQIILNEKNIRIRIPKFIGMSSNWSKRKHQEPTEVTTESPLISSTSTSLVVLKSVSIMERVFEFYCKTFNRKPNQYTLTPKRKQKILSRLKEGFTEEQMKQAIVNRSKSDYHIQNDYIDIERHIFKSREYLEDLLLKKEKSNGRSKGSSEPVKGKYADIGRTV